MKKYLILPILLAACGAPVEDVTSIDQALAPRGVSTESDLKAKKPYMMILHFLPTQRQKTIDQCFIFSYWAWHYVDIDWMTGMTFIDEDGVTNHLSRFTLVNYSGGIAQQWRLLQRYPSLMTLDRCRFIPYMPQPD